MPNTNTLIETAEQQPTQPAVERSADREERSSSGSRTQSGDTEPTVDEPILRLDGVTNAFGSETAVREVSLTVERGELLTMLGPSGCGKTTTLRMIAGLETPSEGEIELDDELVATDGSVTAPEQ